MPRRTTICMPVDFGAVNKNITIQPETAVGCRSQLLAARPRAEGFSASAVNLAVAGR
jgi:hypothetical protein